jgi:hypothetical protein
VAVVKGSRGLRIITSSEALDCERVAYDSRPGAFIVVCFDGSSTSVITLNYSGLRVYRGLYRKKPVSVHAGFNSRSVVFEDYRSIIIYGDNPIEIGIPILATAYTGSSFSFSVVRLLTIFSSLAPSSYFQARSSGRLQERSSIL